MADYALNASHRCDRCGSRAYVATILRRSLRLPHAGELYWCAHHWREVAYALSPFLVYIVDEQSQLFEGVKDDGHVTPGQEAHQRITPPKYPKA